MFKLPTNKGQTSKAGDLLQEIQIRTCKGEEIKMDFVVGSPRTQKSYDCIWVVVDRLPKSACFIPVKST